ncbi:MAG TPA: patatin-like phospholipase family protein [Xanthobacteraceae bacterium]|nr:patatin-like phospholipase family protein [Xanthobacteraceae bacterium]
MTGWLHPLDPRRLLTLLSRTRPAPEPQLPPDVKRIRLALQGGGAHGAFTWGVLDALLEDERIAIDALSGASAGALNAVILVDGLRRGGRAEAKRRLAAFWRAVSRDGNMPDAPRKAFERFFRFVPMAGGAVQPWLETLAQFVSPYDFNPLNINPLRELIERFVDFEALRATALPQLFISATNVETGRMRIFPRQAITAEAVMASAALPFLFRAVEIDGVPYWDGGYVGNPPLLPLYGAETADILIVQINPLRRGGVPTSAKEIMNRVHEITFNAPLLTELRAIAFVERLRGEDRSPPGAAAGDVRRINLHRIALDARGLGAESRLNNDFDMFLALHAQGRQAARRFLEAHFDDLGRRGTVDLEAELETAQR